MHCKLKRRLERIKRGLEKVSDEKRETLEKKLSEMASEIAAGLFFFGIWSGDLWLMIIAFFIAMADGGEYQATITHLALKRVPLSKLVSRDYLLVSPTETLNSAALKMIEEKRSAAIVSSKPPLVLNLTDLGRAPKTAKAATAARDVGTITLRDSSEAAYRKLAASDSFAVPVVSNNRLVGVVYRADIEKTVRILSALKKT
ncbi:hypothetical protein HYS54_05355 [Candidatus Micrarchaeota archaeon]|nr:hypothetical protein [Candidatus Micrarchaeota archaeon]